LCLSAILSIRFRFFKSKYSNFEHVMMSLLTTYEEIVIFYHAVKKDLWNQMQEKCCV